MSDNKHLDEQHKLNIKKPAPEKQLNKQSEARHNLAPMRQLRPQAPKPAMKPAPTPKPSPAKKQAWRRLAEAQYRREIQTAVQRAGVPLAQQAAVTNILKQFRIPSPRQIRPQIFRRMIKEAQDINRPTPTPKPGKTQTLNEERMRQDMLRLNPELSPLFTETLNIDAANQLQNLSDNAKADFDTMNGSTQNNLHYYETAFEEEIAENEISAEHLHAMDEEAEMEKSQETTKFRSPFKLTPEPRSN